MTIEAVMPAQADLERAIQHTVVYADIFNYPLKTTEIQRYLIGVPASLDEVQQALSRFTRLAALSHADGFVSLPNRNSIIELRHRRSQEAERLWQHARYYGQLIGSLPFVRMVAVTGSLAVDNADANADIDYMIVTRPGRLWLCRLFVVAVVKWAQTQGINLCPNYFVSENRLVIEQRNLFTAREIAQMVPITGFSVYSKFRALNDWTADYVPNALSFPPQRTVEQETSLSIVKKAAEFVLSTPLGRWLDGWEMNRKIRKLMEQGGSLEEVDFSPDTCKGHFDEHQRRILDAFDERIRQMPFLVEQASAE